MDNSAICYNSRTFVHHQKIAYHNFFAIYFYHFTFANYLTMRLRKFFQVFNGIVGLMILTKRNTGNEHNGNRQKKRITIISCKKIYACSDQQKNDHRLLKKALEGFPKNIYLFTFYDIGSMYLSRS